MTVQMHEPGSNKQQRRKQFPWVLWTVVSAIIIAIIAFTIAVFLILHNQGLALGISTLTIISIVIGVVIGLLGLMISFLQWHHPKPSTIPEPFTALHTLSQPIPSTGPTTEFSASFERSSLPTQTASSSTINSLSSPVNTTSPLGEQFNKDTGLIAVVSPKVDWGEAPHISQFYGRDRELATLGQWIVRDGCRVVAMLGIGGIGKTALAAKLAEWVKDEFAYVFWRSLQNAPSLESILKNCLKFFSNHQRTDLPEDLDGQITLLIEYLRDYRCLLVLDNMETILQGGKRAGQYREGYEGYGKLIQRIGEVKHASCLLLTSREKPKEVVYLEGETSPVRSLSPSGLDPGEGQELLKDKGLFGSEEAWAELIHLYAGNPLALKLAAEPIRELFEGSIASFLKQGKAVFGDIRDPLDLQFNRLSEPERKIMYWLAVEREAVSLDNLREEIVHPILSEEDLLVAIGSLRRRSMMETIGAARFTLQPVIMEYLTDRFVEQVYEEINNEAMALFTSHALIKAQAKDYVRDSQIRLILKPLTERLLSTYEKAGIEKKLRNILSTLRQMHPQYPSYAAGNILNLLVQLKADLRDYDFSYLIVWQAYLRGVALPRVNFRYANLATSVFTDTFGSIIAVTFSPDGELVAAGTANGEIRLWQINGKPLLTYDEHGYWIYSIAFSPNGKILASSSEGQTIRLWDVHSGQVLMTLQGHTNRGLSVTFSHDGKMLASGNEDKTIQLWDVHSGQVLMTLQGHTNQVRSVTFSPDGKILASGSEDQTVRLWDIHSGQTLMTLQGHINQVRSVAFSPDGKVLASGSADQSVRLWNISTGQCINILQGHSNWVRSVAFSPNGKVLASGSADRTIRLWDISTGQCINILQGHTNQVRSVAFNSSGSMLVSGSDDQTIRLWDVHSGQVLTTLQGHTNRVWSVAFSPDGKMLASGNEDKTIQLWDVHSGQVLMTLQGHTNRILLVTFSLDGKILASGSDDQTIRLWDVHSGQVLTTLQGHTNRVWSVAFSPDGKMLASGSQDQSIRLWNISTGQCINISQGRTNWTWSVAFSPNGKTLASGSDDQTIRLWDVHSGQVLTTLQGHTNQVRSVTFSPDGKTLASGSDDRSILLWDIHSGQVLTTLQGHTNRLWSVAFSPDGKILASGGDDQTIRLWDTSTGQCINILQGHTNLIRSVTFSPDGKILVSGGDDGKIMLWDLQTGEHLKTLRSDRPYEHMDITGVTGLTEAQKATLRELGAIENGD